MLVLSLKIGIIIICLLVYFLNFNIISNLLQTINTYLYTYIHVSSSSHRRRICGFFIIYCRRLSAVSSIEVYRTAISRTDLCTRHSTVQYTTVHRIRYNHFGKQRLPRMTLSLLMLPCASLTPVPVSYTHTHTSPATVPSATRRHVSCHVINGQPRPHLLTIMKLTATLLLSL